MSELEKVIAEIENKLGVSLTYYTENTRPENVPVCDKAFEETTDDGSFTYFRFLYRNKGYVGVLKGVGEAQNNYATLLPTYIESFAEKELDLSKAERLKRILLGESSFRGIYKFASKYSVKGMSCFVIALRVPKLIDEALSVLEQYGGNSLDCVLKIDERHCVLVKFVDEEDGDYDYRSSVDYAEFLVHSLKQELGVETQAGVGPTVRDLKDAATSYTGADNALRYADVFELNGNVHSYREFLLIKMMEGIPESKLMEYLTEMTDEQFKEVFEDEEMLSTAEAFLQSSLNVSETSRNLYMHRNTLLYRLDKIEKATGLNIRLFSDAVSFRVLNVMYKLLGKK